MRFHFSTVLVLSALLVANTDAWRWKKFWTYVAAAGAAAGVLAGSKRAEGCQVNLTAQQVEELKKTCQDLKDNFKDGLSQEDINALFDQCDEKDDDVILGTEIQCFSAFIQAVQDCASLEENQSK